MHPMTNGQEATQLPVQKERKKPGRVPTSCAECRRLKLRCDRKVPCENCFKRGCGAICPTGSLTTGKGNRLVLASTAELHNKIESMTARIRELEAALAQKSDGQRRLSLDDSSPDSQSSMEKTSSDSPPEPESNSFIDAFGTLTIGDHGETSFMSFTARAEYLIGRPLQKAPTWATMLQVSRLPARVINASRLEHDVTPVDNELRQLVMGRLPPRSEAIRLCGIYLEWGKTLWTPLSPNELLEEVTGSVYHADSYESIPNPHSLSLLFSTFALASLFDLERPAYGIEAYDYYILSRVALEFSSPCAVTTLHTLCALANNIQWLDLSNLQMDPSWTYTLAGQGVRLAYRMGLRRLPCNLPQGTSSQTYEDFHSARFRLEKSVSQKRDTLFWQIFLIDTTLSFYAGRPPNVSLDWIDAPYPDDEFPLRNEKGELEMSWRSWSWRFSKLLHGVFAAAFGAKIPKYNTVLKLDRKIRDFLVPSHLQLQCTEDTSAGPQVILQQLLVLAMKESALLNMHRRYFAQALQDSPSDPLNHRYGPSVMAIYRSAWRLIGSHISGINRIPDLVARIPIIWSQAFSAAIVMCMIVTRAPSSNIAASSLHEIDVLYDVFKKAAPTMSNARNYLDHVERIWRKSQDNISHHSECILSRAELDRVGGGSTSVISKNSSSHCPSAASSPDSSCSQSCDVTTPPSNSPFDFSSTIHPRIMEDLQSFAGFQVSVAATGGPDYAPPERFSQSMVDTQFTQFMEAEATVTEALNGFYPSKPQMLHPSNEGYVAEGVALDSAWQSFMEQLGF